MVLRKQSLHGSREENMAKSRQIHLPGWESDGDAAAPDPKSPAACEFPDTPSTAEMGIATDEKPAEPVEAQVTMPDLTGKTVYVVDSHSLIFQVFHALAGNDQSARRADRGDLRFRPRHDVLAGREEARLFACGVRFVGADVSPRIVHRVQRTALRNARCELRAANPQHSANAGGAGNSGAGVRGL